MYYTKISAFFTANGKGDANLLSMSAEVDGCRVRPDKDRVNADLRSHSGSDAVYYLMECISREYSRVINKIRKRKKNQIQLY
jgi:hypothetical protein